MIRKTNEQYMIVANCYSQINGKRDVDHFALKFSLLAIAEAAPLPQNHFESIFKRTLNGLSYRDLLDKAVQLFLTNQVDCEATLKTMETLAGAHDLILNKSHLLPKDLRGNNES